MNIYSNLYYESDDEEYEKRMLKEEEEKRRINEEKRRINEEKRRIKDDKRRNKEDEKIKQRETDYTNSIKRTKIYDKIKIGFKTFNYVSEIKEDKYNIAKYLNLDGYLEQTVYFGKFYGLFSKNEYLDMVKNMEFFKNKNCPPIGCLEYIRDIQQNQISDCVINNLGTNTRMVYEIYVILLLDTPCVRKAFNYYPHGKYLMKVFKESLEDKIKNPYKNIAEFEQEYYDKYFELGKRYFAKRNNFKVLFRNYIKFVGKLMILYKRR
jgi:hypothetical protein